MLVIRPGQSPIAVGGTWWEAIVGGAVAGWNDDSPVHTRRTIARATVKQMTAPAVTETFENIYQTVFQSTDIFKHDKTSYCSLLVKFPNIEG